MIRMIRTGLIITAIAVIGMASINFWAIGGLPEGNIPVHWGADGTPDRYADRSEAVFTLWMIPVITLFSASILALAPLLEPLKDNLYKSRTAYTVIWSSVMLLMLAVQAGIAYMMVQSASTNVDGNEFVRFIMAAAAIMFIIKGNYLPKTRQNWFLGIRTPWTLSSASVWEKTHRLAGRLFVLTGFINLIAAFVLDGVWLVFAFVGCVLAAALISVAYSYIAWRSATDKAISPEYVV